MKLNEIKLNRLTKGVQDYQKTLDVISQMDLDPDRVDDWFKEHGTDHREHRSTGFMLASFIAHVVFHLQTYVQINELGFLSELYRNLCAPNFTDLEVSSADAYVLLDTFFDDVFEDQLLYEITENRPVSKFVKDYRNTLDCLFRIIGYLDNFNKFIVAELDGLLDNGDSKEELLARYICETVFGESYKDGKLAKLYIENFVNGYAKNDELIMNYMYDQHWCERGKKPDPFGRSTGTRLLKVLATFLSETKRRKEKEKERMNNKNREVSIHIHRGATSEENLKNDIHPVDCNHKCPCNKDNCNEKAMNVDQLITILMHVDKSSPVPPEVEAWAKLIEHEEEEFAPFIEIRERIQAFSTKEIGSVKIKDVNTKDKQIDRLAQEICNIVFEIHPPTAKECLRYITYVYRNIRNLLSDNIDQLTPWEYCPEFWTSCIVDRGWGHIGNDEKVHLNDLGNDIYDLLEAFDMFIHASKVITNK